MLLHATSVRPAEYTLNPKPKTLSPKPYPKPRTLRPKSYTSEGLLGLAEDRPPLAGRDDILGTGGPKP